MNIKKDLKTYIVLLKEGRTLSPMAQDVENMQYVGSVLGINRQHALTNIYEEFNDTFYEFIMKGFTEFFIMDTENMSIKGPFDMQETSYFFVKIYFNTKEKDPKMDFLTLPREEVIQNNLKDELEMKQYLIETTSDNFDYNVSILTYTELVSLLLQTPNNHAEN